MQDVATEIDLDFESAEALAIWFNPLHCIIVWKDHPKPLRPKVADQRIRDLRAGDEVIWNDELHTVSSVAVYR